LWNIDFLVRSGFGTECEELKGRGTRNGAQSPRRGEWGISTRSTGDIALSNDTDY